MGSKTVIHSLAEADKFIADNPTVYLEGGKAISITVIAITHNGTTYVYREKSLLEQWLQNHFKTEQLTPIVMYVPEGAVRPTCPQEILDRISEARKPSSTSAAW